MTESSILAIAFIVPIYFAADQITYNLFILNKQVIFHCLLAIGWIGQLLIINYQCLFNYLKQNKIIFILIFLLLLSSIASTIFSIHPAQSLWGSFARQEGLYSNIYYLLFFVLLILFLQKNNNQWPKIKHLILTIMLSSFFVSLYGILQYLGLDFLVWENSSLALQRVVSTLGQPNFLGHYLIIVIPLTIFGLFFITKKFLPRFFISILITMQLICLLVTYSRAAWVGFAGGLFIFFILNKNIFFKKYFKFPIIIYALIILLFIGNNLNLENRIKSIFNFETGSNKVRILTWEAAIDKLKNTEGTRLLLGHGPDTQQSIFAHYYQPEWGIYETVNVYPDRAHNIILDSLLQFGIIYCYISILLYGYIILKSLKFLKKRDVANKEKYWLTITCLVILTSYFINNLFSFSLVVTSIYLYFVLAILSSIITKSLSKNKFTNVLSMRLASFFACLLLIFIVYNYDIKAIKADYYYMNAEKARINNNCEKTLKNIEKAIELNQRNNFYKEGYIEHSINCLKDFATPQQRYILSKKIINQINSILPKEYTIKTSSNIAHAYSLLGVFVNPEYYKLAYGMYDEIIKINPYFTSVYRDLAKLNLWQKKYDQALINLDQFFNTLPPTDHPHLNIEHRKEIEAELLIAYKISGDIFKFKGNSVKAIDYYKMALNIDPYNKEVRQKLDDMVL